MWLEKNFSNFFDLVYSGQKYDRDRNLLFDFCFPKDPNVIQPTLREISVAILRHNY